MRRADLLAELKAEYQSWERLLAEIGEDRMDEPSAAGAWSIKNVVAHLTAWRRRTVGRLEAVAQGQPQPKPTWPAELTEDDDINAWFHARDRDKSVSEVLSEARRVFQQLVSAIEKVPEDKLADPKSFPWMEGTPLSGAAFFSHFHDEHEGDMRAFLARRPARQ
jgi:hypothetical protein